MTTHQPVLLNEVLEALHASAGPRRYLDATFGGGGHTRALLNAHQGNTVTALDVDPDARDRASELQTAYGDRFEFHAINFAELDAVAGPPFDGILFDLGLSSFHYDTPERGFSFRHAGPADMRLNPQSGVPASTFLEQAPESDLVHAVRDFGEEPNWRRVVRAIMAARGSGALARTDTLAALIEDAVGKVRHRGRQMKIHPATRAFQGIRIAVNRELEVIETALPKAFERLAPEGRMAVISFHSLEDRIVKRFFRSVAGQPINRFDNRPAQARERHAHILTSRPVVPGDEEIEANPRARSSKLRVLEKDPGK